MGRHLAWSARREAESGDGERGRGPGRRRHEHDPGDRDVGRRAHAGGGAGGHRGRPAPHPLHRGPGPGRSRPRTGRCVLGDLADQRPHPAGVPAAAAVRGRHQHGPRRPRPPMAPGRHAGHRRDGHLGDGHHAPAGRGSRHGPRTRRRTGRHPRRHRPGQRPGRVQAARGGHGPAHPDGGRVDLQRRPRHRPLPHRGGGRLRHRARHGAAGPHRLRHRGRHRRGRRIARRLHRPPADECGRRPPGRDHLVAHHRLRRLPAR